jgi:XTP/dITP diphosphohydrolase
MSPTIEFLFATGNAHKVAELQALADAFRPRVRIRGAREAGGMPPVVENAGTFAGNAAKKARVLHMIRPSAWVLADDSGLCVDALDGEPGVESANYASHAAPGTANIAKLLRALDGVPTARRGAHFVCVLYVVLPDGREFGFKGKVDGVILKEPSGAGGFGYDPVFQPVGYRKSFAELGAEVKNTISHRARAWAQLCTWLRAGGG